MQDKIILPKRYAYYIVILAAIGVGAMALVQTERFYSYTDDLFSNVAEIEKSDVTLSLITNSSKIKLGQIFDVEVRLDTNNVKIDGVDLYALRYDPGVLAVVDADQSQSGVQISPAGLLPIVAYNKVDEKSGSIRFAQVTGGGSTFSGRGRLATIKFQTLKKGNTSLSFDFEPGDTTDTNVAAYGKDKLTSVETLKLTIE